MSAASAVPAVVLIGNPENRRATLFCDAVRRMGLPPPTVVSYERWLTADSETLAAEAPQGAIVRLDSPGENMTVEAALIARGARLKDVDCRNDLAALAERGRIVAPQLWFVGYRDLLTRIEKVLAPGSVRWMNHPAEIPQMFDKTECAAILRCAGVSISEVLSAERAPRDYAELRELMRLQGRRRVFVKLRYGSSASGVVALQEYRGQVQAVTSTELVFEHGERKLFNSLRVRRYRSEPEVAQLIDGLCEFGVHVERWLPKAGWRGRTFDLRVLTIGGRVWQGVMRTSRGPLTNLHLGNQRGDLDSFLASQPAELRERLWQSCATAAAAFPRSLYTGIDLALTPDLRRHAILEVNAFGDLLPGISAEGRDAYEAELDAMYNKRTLQSSPCERATP